MVVPICLNNSGINDGIKPAKIQCDQGPKKDTKNNNPKIINVFFLRKIWAGKNPVNATIIGQ